MMCVVRCQFEFLTGMLLRNVITACKKTYRKKNLQISHLTFIRTGFFKRQITMDLLLVSIHHGSSYR